jgi:radical SAM protein with 4Fe4S-binding SPASM domain
VWYKELVLEITDKCSLDCKFCYSNSNKDGENFINYNILDNLINDCNDLNIYTICISGGEPFIHPKIVHFLKKFYYNGNNTFIYTSGSIYKKNSMIPVPKKMLKKVKKYKMSLRFNIQSFKEEIHDNITQTKDSYKNVMETLKKAIKLKIPCEVHVIPTVLNTKDYNELVDMFNRLKIMGVKQIKILRLINVGKSRFFEELDHESDVDSRFSFSSYIDLTFKQLKKKFGEFIRLSDSFCYDNYTFNCNINHKLTITPDGKVYPCVSTKTFDMFNFSIYDTSLKEIIQSDKYNDILNFFCIANSSDFGCPSQFYNKTFNKNNKMKENYSNVYENGYLPNKDELANCREDDETNIVEILQKKRKEMFSDEEN